MNYEAPTVTVIELPSEDVIRTSTPFVDADDWLDQN
jgi:hypothetical protein